MLLSADSTEIWAETAALEDDLKKIDSWQAAKSSFCSLYATPLILTLRCWCTISWDKQNALSESFKRKLKIWLFHPVAGVWLMETSLI